MNPEEKTYKVSFVYVIYWTYEEIISSIESLLKEIEVQKELTNIEILIVDNSYNEASNFYTLGLENKVNLYKKNSQNNVYIKIINTIKNIGFGSG